MSRELRGFFYIIYESIIPTFKSIYVNNFYRLFHCYFLGQSVLQTVAVAMLNGQVNCIIFESESVICDVIKIRLNPSLI